MIEITFNPDNNPQTRNFEAGKVTVGRAPDGENHCSLDFDGFTDVHLEVIKDGAQLTIVNVSGDATTLVNGEAFERTESDQPVSIQVGEHQLSICIAETEAEADMGSVVVGEEELDDLLAELEQESLTGATDEGEGDYDIEAELSRLNELFEEEGVEVAEGDSATVDKALSDLVEAKTEDPPLQPGSEPKQATGDDIPDEDVEFCEDDPDDFLIELSDVEPMEERVEEAASEAAATDELQDDEIITESDTGGKIEVIDEDEQDHDSDHIYEEDDADYIDYHDDDQAAQSLLMQRVALLVVTVLLLSGAAGASYYIVASRGNVQEEIIASQGIADIAMALTRARIEGVAAPHSKLGDAGFVLSNLDAVMSPEYRALSPLNEQLGLDSADFTIKVYSSTDGSRFLVMALPNPCIRQSLVPKSVLVIGSNRMQVRRMHMLKRWDELLRDGTSLDYVNGQDINSLLLQEELIHLPSLNGGNPRNGFTPPEALAFFSEDAPHYAYNAPRYFKLTQSCVQEIHELIESAAADQATVDLIKERCKRLTQLPHLVLYSLGDQLSALQVSEGLQTLSLNDRFFIGFISVSTRDGLVDTAGLLPGTVTPVIVEEERDTAEPEDDIVEIVNYSDHPIFLAVEDLINARRDSLELISKELIELMLAHNQKAVPNFIHMQEELGAQYLAAEKEAGEKFTEGLNIIYRDLVASDRKRNLKILIAAIKEFELEPYTPKHILLKQDLSSRATPPKAEQIVLLEEVAASRSLRELESTVGKVKEWLNSGTPASSDLRLGVQNQLRSLTLKKVGEFVLSPQHSTTLDIRQASNQNLVEQILNDGGVTDEQARDFYLEEFDLLVGQLRRAENHPEIDSLKEATENAEAALADGKETLSTAARKELLDKARSLQAKLDPHEKRIDSLREQIDRIPLDVPVTVDSDERKQDLSRLAQQILIEESGKEPSDARSARVREAIGLLRQATDVQRPLWQDILDGHRLIVENIEKDIQELLESDIGLDASAASRVVHSVSALKNYIRDKRALAEILQPDEMAVQLKLFEQSSQGTLLGIAQDAETIGSVSTAFAAAVSRYVAALDQFSQDYEQARKEGLAAKYRGYHGSQIRRLHRKFGAAKALDQRTQRLTKELGQLSNQLSEIVSHEQTSLKHDTELRPESLETLQAQANRLPVPNLIAEQLPRHAGRAFSVNVYPRPATL